MLLVMIYGTGDIMGCRKRFNGSLCVAFGLGMITAKCISGTAAVIIIAVLLIIVGIAANSRC